MAEQRVLVLGAAGRDFHNFNVCLRDVAHYRVVGFTATQIPGIANRVYPAELAGPRYPQGIPIFPESELPQLISRLDVTRVVFAYSDVSHEQVMHLASTVLAAGADFSLLGGRSTMLQAEVPVVAVCAVRTGCGKSQTSRYVAERIKRHGRRVVVIRHPMPYGELTRQVVQRFASYEDLSRHDCTIEEREEYETHLECGTIVYAGVDYAAILAQAQAEADVVLWDGGNNDTPFIRPDLWITVADPLRAGHEVAYHPGETNLRAADVVVLTKMSQASGEAVSTVQRHVVELNPKAAMVHADSMLTLEPSISLEGKRVLTIEDGPSLTHGSMPFGAARVAAERFGAGSIVDPRPCAVGSIAQLYTTYPHVGATLPAMGYSESQVAELQATINQVDADVVLYATPIDLGRLLRIAKPAVRVRYELKEVGGASLAERIDRFVQQR